MNDSTIRGIMRKILMPKSIHSRPKGNTVVSCIYHKYLENIKFHFIYLSKFSTLACSNELHDRIQAFLLLFHLVID